MSYTSEKILPVDIQAVLSDEALCGMADGPARRFLVLLSRELDHDAGAPPVLLVRRAS